MNLPPTINYVQNEGESKGEHLRRYGKACARAALEEAAMVCRYEALKREKNGDDQSRSKFGRIRCYSGAAGAAHCETLIRAMAKEIT